MDAVPSSRPAKLMAASRGKDSPKSRGSVLEFVCNIVQKSNLILLSNSQEDISRNPADFFGQPCICSI